MKQRNIGCKLCGYDLAIIKGDEFSRAINMIRPNLRSLSIPMDIRKGKAPQPDKSYRICPRCDAYALGIELIEGFEIFDDEGNRLSVHLINGIE
jgi:hypothetical protein